MGYKSVANKQDFNTSRLQYSPLYCVQYVIAMFPVMLPFVINVPTRDLLVPYTKRSFEIMVGTLALQLFVNTKHRYREGFFKNLKNAYLRKKYFFSILRDFNHRNYANLTARNCY